MSAFTLPAALRDEPDFQLPPCLLEADESTEFLLPAALQEANDEEAEAEISLPPALVEDEEPEEDEDEDDEEREPGRFYCRECGRYVTRSVSGKEYGHRRRPRCPRRETNVDPGKGPKSREQRRV